LEEDPFELDHAGVGKEEGGVVIGHQGRTLDDPMTPFVKIV
jgi:hypothetical protein